MTRKPNQGLSVETVLCRKARGDKNAASLWHKYRAMKDYLSQKYYPWIQANSPYFTDHGRSHVESVIQSASQILENTLEKKTKPELTPLDLYIMLCAIIWHDVGMALDRSTHSRKVEEVSINIKELGFPDPSVYRLVDELAKAHVQRHGLKIPEREQDCTVCGKTYTVFPRALAAIVRFADEISENRSRISYPLLKQGKVPKEKLIYWEYAYCIAASRADPYRERVIITAEIEANKAVSMFVCPDDCRQYSCDGKSISLIKYFVARLQKMNNERIYCAREFGHYTSIRTIEARLKLIKDGERIENYGNVLVLDDSGLSKDLYPQVKIFADFFEQHPHWSPDNISKVKKK